MSQKIFLTSCIAMGVIAPAMAETFPSNGLMQQNKTYDNAATSTNMDGVYSGTVNAVAEYDIIDYIVNAGQYLPADSETVITCPAGSFCPGISGNVQYNQSSDQGIQTCPTGYTSSATGASSDIQCYRACDINNMGANGSIANIAHATAISGNDYYGAGTDTCEPTACENGWHVKDATPDLMTVIGASEGTENYGFVSSNADDYENTSEYGLSTTNDRGKFVMDYGDKGILRGTVQCSTQIGTGVLNGASSPSDITTRATLPDNSGTYCWCRLDSFTANGSNTAIALSGPWVFVRGDRYDSDSCDSNCAADCVIYMSGYSPTTSVRFRTAMSSAYQPSPAMCEANTITINWSDASQTDIDANNAETATYGSDVRTPVKAATKKGQTFRGWRFSAPEQTNLSE